MARLEINFYSKTLDRNETVTVILPEKQFGIGMYDPGVSVTKATASWNGETPLKTLYLLHGYSDDHTIWSRRTSLERYVAGKQIAVIMPSACNSYYIDEKGGWKYWTYISEELPEIMSAFFKLSDKREDHYVAGLSMGAFGSLKMGLLKSNYFSKCAAMSGGTFFLDEIEKVKKHENSWIDEAMLLRVFGSINNPIVQKEDTLEGMIEYITNNNFLKPDIYLSTGELDPYINDFLRESHILKENGFNVLEKVVPGLGHQWKLWDDEIQEVLKWIG